MTIFSGVRQETISLIFFTPFSSSILGTKLTVSGIIARKDAKSSADETLDIAKYFTPMDHVTASLRLFSRAINGISEDVRVSERLSVPSKYLRGFERGRIGPVDTGEHIGGNLATAFGINTQFTNLFPNFTNTNFGLFFDTANVWGVDFRDSYDDSNKIRSSTGIAVDWWTPIGPLNFSLAKPITKVSTDKTESFQFNLGTTF